MQKLKKLLLKQGEKINFLTAKKLFNDGLKEILFQMNHSLWKILHTKYYDW